MSDKITNTQDRPEEKPLTEQELQFCNLYVNGGLEYAGRPKKCFVEVFGEDTVKNPYASANYLMNKTACAGTYQGIALLGTVRDGDDGCKAAGDRDSQGNHGRDGHFGLYRPFRCAALSGTAQGRVGQCRQGADGYLPHQAQGGEPPAYRRQRRQCYLQCNRTPKSCKKMAKRKRKITKEEIAWWVYLAMMIALVIYGFRDSAAAETLLRAIRDAFSLLME